MQLIPLYYVTDASNPFIQVTAHKLKININMYFNVSSQRNSRKSFPWKECSMSGM